jgi:hypothetical protein
LCYAQIEVVAQKKVKEETTAAQANTLVSVINTTGKR